MAAAFSWIRPEPWGLHVVPADFWIDPARPVERALVTHGHADHARGGHGLTIATPETLLEHAGERIVVTGDYKRAPDPTCAAFAVTPCDLFVTEATFGLPLFKHPPIEHEIVRLLEARNANSDRAILVGAYALGKAQRLIAELRRAGHHEPIYLHGAMERMCRLYEDLGVPLGDLQLVAGMPKGALGGQIVVCPPSALNDRWSRRLPDPITAMASGWMQVRQRARQKNVELPMVISDHADWQALTDTIAEVNPAETWITHGREEALLRWCELNQRRARALALVGYEDEDD
jgi:putative mRNA 3-end processing factor